jgi:alpha-L-rhamnosidase
MSTLDRRTFLARGAQASAAVAVGGAITIPTELAQAAPAGSPEASAATSVTAGPLRAGGLTVNGAVSPICVDPDDCAFAWTLGAVGRSAVQRAYRIVVQRQGARPGTVWDSGAVESARQAFVYYSGPALEPDMAYTWSVRVRGATGGWSPVSGQGSFATSMGQQAWTATWLAPGATNPQPNRVTYLRREVALPAGRLRRATAFVAAAHTYQLFVNGSRLDLGPSFCYPDEQYYRCVDITGALRTGHDNVVGLLHHWYGPGQGRPASAPGLLCQLSIHYDDGRHVVVGTDGSWKELTAEWLPSPQRTSDGGDFVEWVDGRAHPTGWDSPGYDETAWQPASLLGPLASTLFTHLVVQRTNIEDRVVQPVSLHTLPNGSIVADFGAVYAARLRVRFARGQDGRTVPMHVGYLLDPDGQVSTLHGTQESNLSFSYITRDGDQTFEALTYLGFRYLQIDQAGETMARDQIAAVTTHTAMPDMAMATFSTANRMLNAVWKLNARSCLYCCHEQFVDTPTREKGQFVWDAANESEAVMRAYGEQNLTWQGLRDVARGQARYHPDGRVNAVYPNGDGARDIPTFTARYPEWLWRYYVATGDLDTSVILYPVTVRVANYLWAARNSITGLLEGLADGDDGDPIFGYDLGVAADTVSNVLAINAFTRVAQLADVAGDAPGAALQRSRAAQLAGSVNSVLRMDNGIYVDGLNANGAPSSHASQAANALALAYNVVPDNGRAAVGAYVASLGISVGPNHGLELLRGLANAELWDDLVRLLTDAKQPGWAHIVASGGTFTWETWTPSDLIGDSLSHGWGSSALVAMGESLLGVTLITPTAHGAVRATISPPRSGLRQARGSVPTIAGPITVSWTRTTTTFTLETTIPANAAAAITLPAASASSLREQGNAVGPLSGVSTGAFGNGLAYLTVGSGSYRFTSSLRGA